MTAKDIPSWRLALILAALSMFGPFTIDTIFPAFGVIERDFGISAVAMQQTISVYLVAYALASVFHGPLSDAYGRKPVILVGVGIFLLASVGCALSQSLPQLLTFRALQGVSSGVGLIVGRAIIRDCREGDEAQRLMSLVSMIFTIAPAVAPIVGGWILGWSNWQMIFWFLSAFAAVLLLTTVVALPETHPKTHRYPFSVRQLARVSVAIVRNRQFLLLSLAAGLNFGALFLYIASAPAFVMDILGLNEQQFGWFFVPAVAGMAIGAFLSGRLAGRISGRASASLGFGISTVAVLSALAYNLAVDQPVYPWAVVPVALCSVGVALVFPIVTLAILDLYPRQRGAASSMQAFVTLSFNAFLAGVISPLLSHSALTLALGGIVLVGAALICWRLYCRTLRHELACPEQGRAAALEPTERL